MSRWAPLLLGLAACGTPERFLPPPELADAKTAVIVLHERVPQLTVVDLTADAWSFDVDTTDEATVDLLLYDCDVAGLALEPGRVGLGGEEDPLLPAADRLFTADLGDDDGWRSIAEPPARTSELRLALEAGEPCADVDVTRVELTGVYGEPRSLMAFDDDSVVLALRDGRMFRVHRDGAYTQLWSTQDDARSYVVVQRIEGDRYFFVASGRGCLGRADDLETIRSDGCLPVTSTSAVGSYVRTDARIASDGREILDVLLENGEMFEVVDGVASNVSLDAPLPVGKKGDVLRVADDEVLYTGPIEHSVLRRSGGVLRAEATELPFFDKVVSMSPSRAHGEVVLTNTGLILAYDETTMEWMGVGSSAALQPLFIAEVRRSFWVVGAGEGQVIEVLPNGEGCDTIFVGGDDTRAMTKLGDDGFVFAVRPREDPVDLFFVRPTFSGPTCQ